MHLQLKMDILVFRAYIEFWGFWEGNPIIHSSWFVYPNWNMFVIDMKSQIGWSKRTNPDFLANRPTALSSVFLIFGLISILWASSLPLEAQGVKGYYR